MNSVAIIKELRALAEECANERDACAGLVDAQLRAIRADRWTPEQAGALWLDVQRMPAMARDAFKVYAERIDKLIADIPADTSKDDAHELDRLFKIVNGIRDLAMEA